MLMNKMLEMASLMRGFFMSVQKTMEDDVMSPTEFISETMMAHEGGLSLDKTDTGNYFNGVLVGSKYGVTGAALASYRGVNNITPSQMRDLSREEAIMIALRNYYQKPKIDQLPWNAVTAAILDMAYNAGPERAIKILQKKLGIAQDGSIGPLTVAAYRAFVLNLDNAANAYCDGRCDFYNSIIAKRPANAKYRKGWHNRARSFLPATRWWNQFSKKGS